MMNQGRNKRSHHRLAAAIVVALLFAPGPWMADAWAGTLAQLQAQVATSKLRTAMQRHAVDLCVGGARSASCRVAFETALRQTSQPQAAGSRLHPSVVFNRTAAASESSELQQHQMTLRFNEDPEWKRRAKILARDGLPFVRMPQGANHELLVGVTPHGQLGVSLRDTTGE
jgi:hypothetical protein